MISINNIEEKDVDEIAEFEKEITIISFGDDAVTDIDFHIKKVAKAIKKEKDGMLVMKDGEKIIGWLWMSLKENFVSKEKYINFRSFYIHQDYRGQDCVNDLMEMGMEFCKKSKAKYVVGKVHRTNLPMRALYKNFGFEPTHITMEYNFD